MESEIYTISKYLRGKVRNINVPDEALDSILVERGISKDAPYTSVSNEDRELCLANLYSWVALSPSTSNKITDKDGHWEHSEGGENFSPLILCHYLRMANTIYKRYGLPTVGSGRWGMVGRGIHNIRNNRDRNL